LKYVNPQQDSTVNELVIETPAAVSLRKEKPIATHTNKNSTKNNKVRLIFPVFRLVQIRTSLGKSI